MEFSLDDVERTLRHGFDLVGAPIAGLPAGAARTRAELAQQVFAKMGWAWIDAYGGLRALHSGRTPGRLLIAIVPDSSAHLLESPETFQTDCDTFTRGGVSLKVRTAPFTPLWAGFVLFHELSHVYDLASGLESCDRNSEEFAQGEMRAYHLEMVLVDAYTQGGLTAALTLYAEQIRDLTTSPAMRRSLPMACKRRRSVPCIRRGVRTSTTCATGSSSSPR